MRAHESEPRASQSRRAHSAASQIVSQAAHTPAPEHEMRRFNSVTASPLERVEKRGNAPPVTLLRARGGVTVETFPKIPCKFADWPETAINDLEIAIDETQAEGSVHLIPTRERLRMLRREPSGKR